MSATLAIEVFADIAPPAIVDGMQRTPPVHWHSTALEWASEPGTRVEDGRYVPSGEIEGLATPSLQDTYKTGTGGKTGRAFTVVSGTWKDDWITPWNNKTGLLMQDSTAATTWEVRETANYATTGLTHSQIILYRGTPAPTATHTPAETYAALELDYGDTTTGNYRLAFEWGQPIRLDYYHPDKGGWELGVAVAGKLGDLESYLRNNGGWIFLGIKPDHDRGIMWIEVGRDYWLRHARRPRYATSDMQMSPLPQIERLRFYGKNGTAGLQVMPLRYANPTVRKSPRYYEEPLETVTGAGVALNATGRQELTQTASGSVTQDPDGGLSWEVTASKADAGEGLGASTPPTISDVFCYLPATWDTSWWMYLPEARLKVMRWREHMVWDDASRMMFHTTHLTCNNRDSRYSGAFGNVAYSLIASNGYVMGQRARGIIAPGFTTVRQDPVRLMECVGHDNSYKLQKPMESTAVYDGWSIFAAVRDVLERGQIHPSFLQYIPDWPKGPAGYNCPHYVLGRGAGNHALYEYGPERTCLSVLLELAQDAIGLDNFGRQIPYLTGQDVWGNWRFEPYDVRQLIVARGYSDLDTGLGQIQEMHCFNSVQDMRTSLDFQGQDPWTGELLYLHRDLSYNLPIVGYRNPWTERNSRWVSKAYLTRLADSAQVLASLPQQVIRFRVPYDPGLTPTMLIYVAERQALMRAGLFVVTELTADCGLADVAGLSGLMMGEMWVTARAAETLAAW